jgi:hypothetical protein
LNRSFCSETTFKTHSFPQFPAPAANASGFVQKDSIESPQTYLRFEAFLYAGASDRILISYQNPWNGAHGGRRRSDPEILLRMAAYPSYPFPAAIDLIAAETNEAKYLSAANIMH